VVREAVARYNDSATTRFLASVTLASGTTVRGDVATYRGTLRVLGRIEGRVTVINGSLVIGPGAEVDGEVLVIGGRLVTTEDDRRWAVFEDGRSRETT
jgi:cytoskeletal protein CcmA (bactofilin family)